MTDLTIIICLKELIVAAEIYDPKQLFSDVKCLLASFSVFVDSWTDILCYVRQVLKSQAVNPTFSPEDRIILAAVLSFSVRKAAEQRSNLPSTASESDQLPREEEYIPSTVCSTNLKKKGLPVESLEKETSVSSPKKHKSSHIPPCSMSSDRHQVHHPITQKDDFESYNYLVNLESDMASCKNQKKKGVSINPDSAKTGVSNSCDNNQPSTPRCTMSPDRHQVDHSITQKDDFESYNYQVNLKSDIVSCKNQKKKGVSSNPDSAKIGVSNSCDYNQPSTPRLVRCNIRE